MVAEKKKIFLHMHSTILQRVKQFVNVKIINYEKIKYEKYQHTF